MIDKFDFIKKFLLLLFCGLSSFAWSQQETIFSLYRYHLNLQNPAAIGLAASDQAVLSVRSQWLGVADAPETQALTFFVPSPSSRLHKGFTLMNDQTFVERQTQLSLDFAYTLPLGAEKNIFLGLKVGANNLSLNAAHLATYQSTERDPNLFDRSGLVPNLGVGFHYQSRRFYFAGSIPHLLNTERFALENERVALATDRPHLYLNSAYRFSLTQAWEFVPTLLWTAVKGAPSSSQLDLIMHYQNQFEFGPLYNFQNGVGASLGIKIANTFHLAYAYTARTGTQSSRFSSGSHEIALRFRLDGPNPVATNRTSNPLFSAPKERDIKENLSEQKSNEIYNTSNDKVNNL
jgi:type IX secretion system PorP/SprF family membrane protein